MPSLGHDKQASEEEILAALSLGKIQQFHLTHLFNVCTFHHRSIHSCKYDTNFDVLELFFIATVILVERSQKKKNRRSLKKKDIKVVTGNFDDRYEMLVEFCTYSGLDTNSGLLAIGL